MSDSIWQSCESRVTGYTSEMDATTDPLSQKILSLSVLATLGTLPYQPIQKTKLAVEEMREQLNTRLKEARRKLEKFGVNFDTRLNFHDKCLDDPSIPEELWKEYGDAWREHHDFKELMSASSLQPIVDAYTKTIKIVRVVANNLKEKEQENAWQKSLRNLNNMKQSLKRCQNNRMAIMAKSMFQHTNEEKYFLRKCTELHSELWKMKKTTTLYVDGLQLVIE